jgi:hypothetical protein
VLDGLQDTFNLQSVLRKRTALVAGALTAIFFGGSWVSTYRKSPIGSPPTIDSQARRNTLCSIHHPHYFSCDMSFAPPRHRPM